VHSFATIMNRPDVEIRFTGSGPQRLRSRPGVPARAAARLPAVDPRDSRPGRGPVRRRLLRSGGVQPCRR
jgi:hypothetical protein